HSRPATFDPRQVLPDNACFNGAELGLAARFEDLGDRHLLGGLDLVVGVVEAPSETMGEMPPHRGFARGHETNHVNAGSAFELEVHAVSFNSAMRDSTIEGKRREAATSNHPDLGVTMVRASRSTPRRMSRAHCSAVIAMRRARCTFSGALP